jgi:hypothetical protein
MMNKLSEEKCSLSWDNKEVVVNSVEEMDKLLDDLTGQAKETLPFTVTLAYKDGSLLSIGVGRDETSLSYMDATFDPPYFASLGDKNRQEPIEFIFGGEMTELEPTSAIPVKDAREAMRDFYKTGELSPKIKWQEV